MKKNLYYFMRSRLLLSLIALVTTHVKAQISAYSFTTSSGTYAPITGTDLFGSSWNDNVAPATPIGFSFLFNGTAYSSVTVSSNGFVTFGATAPSTVNYTPISSAAGYSGAITGMGKDLSNNGGTTGISYTTTGTAPNQKCIIQWQNAKRIAGDGINFQIILNQTSNQIDITYGTCVATNTANANKVQVGLRGTGNTDFNNRTGANATAWSALTAGVTNADNVNYKASVLPASGLTFSWLAPACFPPSALGVSGITASSATFSWTSSGTAFDLYYGPTPLTAPTASTVPTTSTTATSFSATGLSSGTAYSLYVRRNCGAGNLSAWTPVSNFTIPCTSVNIPYLQDFETVINPALPTCTSAENVGSGNIWETSSPGSSGFISHALTYNYDVSNAANTWFYTRGLNLTAGVSYRLTYKYGCSSSFYTEKLRVNYGTSPVSSAMTVTLTNHPNIINDVTPINAVVDFTPATTGVYYVGFKAYSTSNQDILFVDDIKVNITPTCFEPTGITVNGVTSTAATATWTPGGAETAWDLFYGPSPLAVPNASTVPTATSSSTSFSLTSLSPGTPYSFYVRGHCSSSDQSTWGGPVSFFTPCLAPNVTSTTPGSRCGIGTATLGATAASGANLNWYTTASGGTSVATGSVYTTPTINTTTTYYVSASSAPSLSSGGLLAPIPSSTVSVSPSFEGLYFDIVQTCTMVSVDVYPDGPADVIEIDLSDNNFNTVGTFTYNIPAGAATTAVTIPVNFVIPPGTGYNMEVSTYNNTNLVANSGGVTYPYTLGTVGSVTSGDGGGFPTYTDYNYLYNIQVSSICESTRTAVPATVTPPPALSLSTGTTVCANTVSTLSVTSTLSNFSGYIWSPVTNLYTNAAGTTPYTGTSASTVYYKSTANGPTVYTVTATSSSNCVNTATTSMTADVPTIQAGATPTIACLGSTVSLQASYITGGTIVTGTTTTDTDDQGITPYSSDYEGSREQYLFTAAELRALNLRAGNISSLSFSVTTQGGGAYAQNNFTIKMAHTSNTSLSSAYGTPTGAFTNVYGPASQGLPNVGLNTYNFSTAFNWDGVSNILVDICHDNDLTATCAGCYSSNSYVTYSTTSFNSVWGSYEDNTQSCGTQANNTVFTYNTRPNIRFGGQVISTTSNITWQWNPGAVNSNTTTVTPTATGPNTYSITATNTITGCSNTATVSFTVNPIPTVSISASTSSLCSGNSASLTASGAATYSWMPAGGASTVAVVSPTANTVYTVTGTSLGCSSTQTTSINVTATPTVVATISPSVICAGATVSLTATGAATYSWSPLGTTTASATATPTLNTTYSVTGTTAGCPNTKTVSVTVNHVPTLTISASSSTLCTAGASATLIATGTSTAYAWSTSASTASISVTPSTTTTYSVTGTNLCGTSTASTTVNVGTLPSVSAVTSSTLLCTGNSAVLTASGTATSYSWSTGATTMSVTISPTITTTYSVTGNSVCGAVTATVVQNVSPCTGIEVLAGSGDISIYPNPAHDRVTVSISSYLASNNTSVEVTDALGRLVIKTSLTTDMTTVSLDKLEEGVYFFKVITDNQTVKIGKVVKQ